VRNQLRWKRRNRELGEVQVVEVVNGRIPGREIATFVIDHGIRKLLAKHLD
jgi:hypothetical protein